MPTFDEIKSILSHYTVGIAGAGGLGSNIAQALVRAGVGRLIIADFDVVSESNLNRQFYFADQLGRYKVEALKENLLRIRPEVTVEIHNLHLTSQNIPVIYPTVDVMVEAFDVAEMKRVLIELFASTFPSIPLVVGNGMAGWGNSNTMAVREMGNLYLCGDGVSEVSVNLPPIAPRVGICASQQANVVVSLLLSKYFGNENNP
ncbi:MAG: sulfur carrier protein ThiS adenylyltransferase ThiF [Tenuifilaceae bacterium]|jgi:sulfur carrier protein ThiS adenylyltransferase|nr:sulfur carrier protein ThiS adenylyltransferase ThiF [Tenuifilaceae bacterium]